MGREIRHADGTASIVFVAYREEQTSEMNERSSAASSFVDGITEHDMSQKRNVLEQFELCQRS